MNLMSVLKSNENTRKVFGKIELKIIEKQLLGINLTQSEKNRLSRDIRKKFEFIKEVAENVGEFKLEKNQDNKRLIDRALNTILEDEFSDNILAVFLFGSFADKTFIRRSDIDICVLFKKDLSLKETTKFRIRVSGQLPKKLDVQVFNVLPLKVKRDIARNHKVLYNVNGFDNIKFSIKYLKDVRKYSK